MCSTQPTPLSSEGRHHSKAQPVIFVSAFHSLVLEITAQFAMDTHNSKLSHLIIMQPSALRQTISSFRISTAAAPSKLVFKCLKWTVACCLEALPCHGTAGFHTHTHTSYWYAHSISAKFDFTLFVKLCHHFSAINKMKEGTLLENYLYLFFSLALVSLISKKISKTLLC